MSKAIAAKVFDGCPASTLQNVNNEAVLQSEQPTWPPSQDVAEPPIPWCAPPQSMPPLVLTPPTKAQADPVRIVPGKTHLFVIGDSLSVGMRSALVAFCKEHNLGLTMLDTTEEGSRIKQWANDRAHRQRIERAGRELTAKLEPDQEVLVLTILGTNDAVEPDKRGDLQRTFTATRKLLSRLLDTMFFKRDDNGQRIKIKRDVLWLGPPSWDCKAQNSVPELLQHYVETCLGKTRFYPTRQLHQGANTLERIAEGPGGNCHLTASASSAWLHQALDALVVEF